MTGSAARARNGRFGYNGAMSDDPRPELDDDDDDSIPCPVYDDHARRPCGEPTEPGALTCANHRVRSTSTEVSRMDNARRRYAR